MKIAFLGNFQIKKGSQVFTRLVEKITAMPKQADRWQFYILGPISDQESWKKIKNKVVKQKPYDNANLPKIMEKEKIDLVITPSIWPETFMMTFFQAAKIGAPVITSRLGFPAYFLQNEDYPLFYEDEEDLKKLLKKLTEKDLRKAQAILERKIDAEFWKKTEAQFRLLENHELQCRCKQNIV